MTIIPKYLQRNVFALLFVLFASSAWAQSASMDELYKKALKEGGTLNFYGTLAQISADKVLPEFEKRFPGIKINHVDATSNKMVARAVAEARGGKTIGVPKHSDVNTRLEMGSGVIFRGHSRGVETPGRGTVLEK